MRKNVKYSVALAAAVMAMAIGGLTVFAAGWSKEGNTWYYYDNSGNRVYDTWKASGDYQFYLGDDGAMVTDSLVEYNGGLYYVNEDGARLDKAWRYVTYNDRDGWMYFQSGGKAKESGYLTIDGKKYMFEDYLMVEGYYDSGENAYYFDPYSTQKSGWYYITDFDDATNGSYYNDSLEEGWYYTDTNGKLIRDTEKKINGYYYSFDENGRMREGMVETTESVTVTDDNGQQTTSTVYVYKFYRVGVGDRLKNQWVWYDEDESDSGFVAEHEEGWYYVNSAGKVISADYGVTKKIADNYGIKKINSKYYCFDKSGKMVYDAVKGYDGTLYYFSGSESDGTMKTGRIKITNSEVLDDGTYYFEKAGSGYTGVNNGVLYEDGLRIEAEDGYENVQVDGTWYVVNTSGKVQSAGKTLTYDGEKYSVTERQDGTGTQLTKIS